jgi:hypothetical protein
LSRFHPFDDCLFKKLGVCCARYVRLSRNSSAKGVKLQGSDASHAWVSVYVPEMGWWNLILQIYNIRERHIVTAYGRIT